jgi:hypothetical protein
MAAPARKPPTCAVGCSPECTICGRLKNPTGRDAPAAMANGLCTHDCPGYFQEPSPCDLWPGECRDCANATGGVCRKHQQPECTCYELTGGHQPGCAFNRSRG